MSFMSFMIRRTLGTCLFVLLLCAMAPARARAQPHQFGTGAVQGANGTQIVLVASTLTTLAVATLVYNPRATTPESVLCWSEAEVNNTVASVATCTVSDTLGTITQQAQIAASTIGQMTLLDTGVMSQASSPQAVAFKISCTNADTIPVAEIACAGFPQ